MAIDAKENTMSIQHITAIGLRLLAIITLFHVVRHLIWISVMVYSNDPQTLQQFMYGVAGILILLVVGLGCWFLPMSTARLIVKPAWDKQVQPFNPMSLLRVLVIFIGLVCFLHALLAASNYLFSWMLTDPSIEIVNLDQMKASYLSTAWQLVLGLVLMNKSHWISQALLNINRAESPDQAD